MNIDHNIALNVGSTLVTLAVLWRSTSLIMSHFNEKMEIYNRNVNEKIKLEKDSAVALAESSYKFLSKTVCDLVDEVDVINKRIPAIELSISECSSQIEICQERCKILRNQHIKEGM